MTYKKNATPKGYKHIWGYHGVWKERKTSPSNWSFTFDASKGKKSKSYGSFKPGFRVKWKINAIQEAIKTGKGSYQTKMKGIKRLIKTGK
jgi:hypothetical protein